MIVIFVLCGFQLPTAVLQLQKNAIVASL